VIHELLIFAAFLTLALATFLAGALTATTTRADREEMGVEL
jgi:hypothetical protein